MDNDFRNYMDTTAREMDRTMFYGLNVVFTSISRLKKFNTRISVKKVDKKPMVFYCKYF